MTEDTWQGDADAIIRVDGTIAFQGQVTAQNSLSRSQTIDLGSYDSSTGHTVTVEFDNAASGGSGDATRTLQVQDILVDDTSTGQFASLTSDSAASFQVAAALPPGAVAPVELGTGSQTIHIQASEDAWQGDAQMVVTVDGAQVGSPITVTALHAQGAVQDILIHGDWGTGQHNVAATFVNDAWGGTADTDRNLYVQDIALDGTDLGGAAALDRNGGTTVAGSFAAQPAAAPTDLLVLNLSEDAFLGDAQFTVSVDGQQLGAAQSVTALHGVGGSQAFSFAASMAPGPHQVSVTFLNDLWEPGTGDRNLYVDAITVNGAAMPGVATTMWSSGQANFTIDVPSNATVPSPTATPVPTPVPVTDPTPIPVSTPAVPTLVPTPVPVTDPTTLPVSTPVMPTPVVTPVPTPVPTLPAAGAVGPTGLLDQVATPSIAPGTRVLTVGADKQFQTVAAALGASRDGDAILVDAGTYTNDFASVTTKVSLYAVGGRVTMLATVPPPNQKGILVEETDLHIEGFTFQGTHIPDDWGHNGAGIRVDNGNLSLVNCAFIGNQDGILTNGGQSISVSIDHSLFDGNGGNDGNGAGNIHAIYVGDVASFTMTNSIAENTLVGHEVKSRAQVNTIVNNTIISGVGTGTGSYAIDLPNGGTSVIRNNTIIKGPNAENQNIIHFGGEGIPYAGSSLLVESNLFSNTRYGAVGVLNQTALSVTITGNVLDGLPAGSLVQGPAKVSGNWDKTAGLLADATLVGVLPGSTMIVTDALDHQVTLDGGQIQAVEGGAGQLSVDVWAGHIVVIGGAGGMDVAEHGGTGGNQYTTAAGSVNSLSLADGMNLVDSEGTDTITGNGNETGVVNGTATITGGAGNSTWAINGTAKVTTGSGSEFLGLGTASSQVFINGEQDFFRLDSNGGSGAWDVTNAGQVVRGAMTGGAVTMQVYSGAMHISTSGGGAGSTLRLDEGDATVVSGGQDVIWAGTGNATVLVSGGAEVHAGTGELAVYAHGGGGGANVYGAAGDYVIGGDSGGVTYHGGDAANTVEAQVSAITVLGGAGLMTVNGGARDTITGGSGGIAFSENGGGANTVTTRAGSTNTLVLTGSDTVDSEGTDTIAAGDSNGDITIGGTASLTLGQGNSHVAVNGHASISAAGGNNHVDVAAGATADVATMGWMTVNAGGPGVSLALLDGQGAEAGRVSLLAGEATLGTYGEYGMQVTTGSGHAEVAASGTNAGGSLSIQSNGDDTIRTGDGAATVTLQGGDGEVWAGSGALTVRDWIGGGGQAVVHGGSGSLQAEVGWGASMTFLGGSGDAVLDGSTMDIVGGSGSITTTGYYGSGVRSFTGGSGAADLRLNDSGCDLTMGSGTAKVHGLGWGNTDIYHFTAASTGTTVIENFRPGADQALLGAGVGIASQDQVDGSAHVRLTNGADVTFVGVQGSAGLFG
ncbi:MAG: beta strand repeat-containing protein [Janthinobacterium lividum]